MLVFRLATKTGLVSLVSEGESPQVKKHALPGQDIQLVAQEPGSADTIYAGTYGNGLFRTQNAGEKWTKLPLPESFVRAIAFSPINPRTVYVGTEPANLFVSHDGGDSWQDLQIRRLPESKHWSLPYLPRSGALRTLAIHPSEPNTILGGVEQGGVITSTNGGVDWKITHSELPKDVHLLSVDQQNHKRVFVATGDGASLSFDGGESWEGLWNSYTRAILVHPTRPNIVFGGPAEDIGKGGSIRMSQDGGATWIEAHGGRAFPLPDMVEFFVIHASLPERVFAVLSDGGLIHSEIDKIFWRDFEPQINGVQFVEIGDLRTSPTDLDSSMTLR